LLLHTSYLPLGVPNWLVKHHAQGSLLHIHITVSRPPQWCAEIAAAELSSCAGIAEIMAEIAAVMAETIRQLLRD
jgi:hypothetical protein